MKTRTKTVLGIASLIIIGAVAIGVIRGPEIEAQRSRTPVASATRTRNTPAPTGIPGTTTPVVTLPPPTSPPGTPPSSANWLANGRFVNDDFSGWSEVKGYWSESLHAAIPCEATKTWWLQLDAPDGSGYNGWPLPLPKEDWAWTDFTAPVAPKILHLSWKEIHHINQGVIRLRIYGYVGDLDEEWKMLYEKNGASSPSGKCGSPGAPKLISVNIPLTEEYSMFRLEVYGKLNNVADALLWGDFKVTGE